MDLNALSLKDELDSKEIGKLLAYMKPLMINAIYRNTINVDNYQFYFNKLLASRDIKNQNDVLTKEKVKADGITSLSSVSGIMDSFFMIYNCVKPDPTIRTAAHVTAYASHMINRTGTLYNYAWGEDGPPPSYQECDQDSLSSKSIQPDKDEYFNEDTEALNKKGRDDLNDLYKNNQKFEDEIIKFVVDETELGNEKILDKRYKHNINIILLLN